MAALLAVAAFAGCGEGAGSTTGSAAEQRQVSQGPSHRERHPVARPTPTAATPQFGRQTKTSGCRARGPLPDAGCTPGSIITQATLGRICVPGYTRAARNVSDALRQEVYSEYDISSHGAGQYEVDHLVPLELGGSNGIANLWPELAPGFGEKDRVENELHDATCSGSIALRQAQVAIARDWRHAGAAVPAPTSPTQVTNAPPPTAPRTPQPTGDFCASHACIPSFATGRGAIVQCQDGQWSHSGGLPGVCSRHGGPK